MITHVNKPHTAGVLKPGVYNLYKNLGSTSKLQVPKGDTKRVPHCGPTNIWHFCIQNLSHMGDLVTGICALLY
jgi:hypothetical protein